MQHICTSFKNLSVEDEIILTIGNFDGIHKGHSTVLNKIKNEAENLQIKTAILSFDPHPKVFINGEKMLTEKTLDHLSGYQGSKPVRIGNAAFIQKQNDIYGILMDAIHFQIEKYMSSKQCLSNTHACDDHFIAT